MRHAFPLEMVCLSFLLRLRRADFRREPSASRRRSVPTVPGARRATPVSAQGARARRDVRGRLRGWWLAHGAAPAVSPSCRLVEHASDKDHSARTGRRTYSLRSPHEEGRPVQAPRPRRRPLLAARTVPRAVASGGVSLMPLATARGRAARYRSRYRVNTFEEHRVFTVGHGKPATDTRGFQTSHFVRRMERSRTVKP
jgi:hypothetical protein